MSLLFVRVLILFPSNFRMFEWKSAIRGEEKKRRRFEIAEREEKSDTNRQTDIAVWLLWFHVGFSGSWVTYDNFFPIQFKGAI